jgi:hypothetical protein
MSMTAALPSPAHIVPSATSSDAWANGRPEDSVQVLADQTDRTERYEGNQCGKQSVLEQVLALFEPQ